MNCLPSKLIELADPDRRDEYAWCWDDLFERSSARYPISRFEQVDLWYQVFAPHARRSALIVEQDGQWIAAVPLLAKRLKHLLPAWEVPQESWSPAPEILVAREFLTEGRVYHALLSGLRDAGRVVFRANEIPDQAPTTRGMVDAFRGQGRSYHLAERFPVGQIAIRGSEAARDWNEFQQRLTSNFRRQMKKALRLAEQEGGVELVLERPQTREDTRRLLQQGFELEDRGWKGVSGSSVLSNPQVWSFYLQQGQFLAARGELLLAFLQLQGRVIAFQCGWGFRRTYYSPKIAYDEAFGHLSPGHLLMHFLLERMFAADEFDTFDFGGPLSQATAKWSTRQYSVICLLGGITPWGDRLLATGVRLKPIKRFLNSTLGTPGLSLLG